MRISQRPMAIALAGVLTFGTMTSAASAQVIVNGGFETNPPAAAGWQTTGQATVGAASSNLATGGTHVGSFELASAFEAASGTVFQDFTVGEAGILTFGFDTGLVFFGSFAFPVTFAFRIDDQIISTALPTYVSDSVTFSLNPLSSRIDGSVALDPGTHRFAFDISREATGFVRGVSFVVDDIETSFAPTAVSGVPEPGTWATMLIGFGAMGMTLRRRRSRLAAVA